jgi:hypothetical protein
MSGSVRDAQLSGSLIPSYKPRSKRRRKGVIEVHLEPFMFPNFLKVREWNEHTYPVHMLSPQQAAEYWDECKLLWLQHVADKAKAHKEWLANEAKFMQASQNTTGLRP